MNIEEKFTGLNDKLESYKPKPGKRDDLINNVMSVISEPEDLPLIDQLTGLVFGWTDILWVKRSMVTVSFLLIFVFVFQHFSIVSRIGQLENRMVESNMEQIIRQQGEYVLLNSELMQEVENTDLHDSILVADKDLRDLINSYSELEKRYNKLKNEYYSQKFNGNTNKQKL